VGDRVTAPIWTIAFVITGGLAWLIWSVIRSPRGPWFDTHSTRSAFSALLARQDDPARHGHRLRRLIRRGDAAGAAALARIMGHQADAALRVGHHVTQPGTNAHRKRVQHIRVEDGQQAVVLNPGQRAIVYKPDQELVRMVARRRRDGAP
jgi:hypothetical protein